MNKSKFSDKDYIDFLIAHPRTFSCTKAPAPVAFDSWYGSLANFKQVRTCGRTWLTQLKVVSLG